jgi:curved DNA-binding protein
MAKNFYDILGISKSADQKDIKQAFRRLARQYHPDLNPGDKEAERRFKEINEANEVLSDPDKRKKYDKYGDNWKYADRIEAQTQNGAPFEGTYSRGGRTADFDFETFGGFGDLFGDLGSVFGRGGRTATVTNVDVPVTVMLEEAFSGAKRQVTIPSGLTERRIEVTIPPGVDTGSRVHISVDKDTQLFLKVTVSSHPRFERQGSDLYTDINVPFEDAILGGETEVQTLTGKLRLKVPPESQNGQKIRLAGQGMPRLNNPQSRGDLYAMVRPTLPRNLTDDERELLKKFQSSRSSRR